MRDAVLGCSRRMCSAVLAFLERTAAAASLYGFPACAAVGAGLLSMQTVHWAATTHAAGRRGAAGLQTTGLFACVQGGSQFGMVVCIPAVGWGLSTLLAASPKAVGHGAGSCAAAAARWP